jgi:hypothetical protein
VDLKTGEILRVYTGFGANQLETKTCDTHFDIDAYFATDIIPRGWESSARSAKPLIRAECKE